MKSSLFALQYPAVLSALFIFACSGTAAVTPTRTLLERQSSEVTIDPAQGVFGRAVCGMPESEAMRISGKTETGELILPFDKARSLVVYVPNKSKKVESITAGKATLAKSSGDLFSGVTDKFIGIDSTADEVKAAYPGATWSRSRPPGHTTDTLVAEIADPAWNSTLKITFHGNEDETPRFGEIRLNCK